MIQLWGYKMECRFCLSENIIKSGTVREKQRYKCKACNKHFVTQLVERGVDPQIKLQALAMLKEGMGFRSVSRLLKVSLSAVLKWFKNKSLIIKQTVDSKAIDEIKEIDVVEIDEMWHYTQKNSEKYGYGLLFLVPRKRSLPLKLALVVKRH
jgi:transposase-like protein